MSPEQTARYASSSEALNCTIHQANDLIDQIAFLGFGKPLAYVLNDAVPLSTAINSMYMDLDTPVYIWGYLPAKPEIKFDFAPLIQVVADSNGDAFVLYEQMQTIINPGQTNAALLYPFVHQMNLDDQLTAVIHSVVLPHTAKPVNPVASPNPTK